MMDVRNASRDHELSDHLPQEVFARFKEAAFVQKFPPHTHIFRQNDPPTGYLYLVKSGIVEIAASSSSGIEMVVDYRHEGQFFGGTPIFTGEPYTAGARTVKATECYLVPENLVKEAQAEFPQLREYFTRVVLSRVKHLYADIVTEHSKKALTQMEAFPFQKRLSEIMSTPVEVCGPQASAHEIARQMSEKGISSVLVLDDFDSPIGIVTERDIVTKVVAPGDVDLRTITAGDIMTEHPFAMTPDDYMYEAMSYMLGHKIKHLPVVDAERAVGIVTMQDLLRFRSQKAMLLIGSVKESRTLDDLSLIKGQIVKVAKALLSETRSPFETMEILSYIHHCLMRRCFEIVLGEMKQEGLTPPDIRFCLIIMGSGGRKEMLLDPDQDNGLVYENFPDSRLAEVDAFFIPFAERLVTAFARIGYPFCNGKVMLNNPVWRGRLKDWEKRISDWTSAPKPKNVMYSTIFFDFMPLTGDPTLCRDLRHIVHREIAGNEHFLYHLLENDLTHKPPLGFLGRFILEKGEEHKGELSLKEAGSIFIVDCLRIFLLERGVDATTTIERLEELVKGGVFDRETAEHLKAAFEAFTFLRLRHEIALIEQGREPSPYIDPYSLTKNEQDLLREAFRTVGKLQDSARRHFGRGAI
jgi:CBS domain-containing protein